MADKQGPVAWAILVDGEVRALCQSADASRHLEQKVIANMLMIEGQPCHNDGTEADVEVAPLVIAQSNTLTAEEREAVEAAVARFDVETAAAIGREDLRKSWGGRAKALRFLLERTK
jgi:uncharacterized protein YacL (UPF0231 family)